MERCLGLNVKTWSNWKSFSLPHKIKSPHKIVNCCMAKNKTAETKVNVTDFINSFVDKDQKKQDSFRLIELMKKWSGFEPKMWGPTIIGFGTYHYKYESGHEGDMPLIGFSPRKAEFSL